MGIPGIKIAEMNVSKKSEVYWETFWKKVEEMKQIYFDINDSNENECPFCGETIRPENQDE